MIHLRTALILLVCAVLARPLHAGFGVDWSADPENVKIVGAGGVEQEFPIVRLSVRGGLFFPGEKVGIGLARPAQPKAGAEDGTIEAVAFNTAQFDPAETGFVESRKARRIVRTAGVSVTETDLASLSAGDDELAGGINVPDAYGMYALVLKRADGHRTLLGSIARVPRPQPRLSAYRQVMAEWGFPSSTPWNPPHRPAVVAAAMARAGIGLVRREVGGGLATPGDAAGGVDDRFDSFFAACREHGIQAMMTAGAQSESQLPWSAPGAVITRILPASRDPELTQWFANFARRHWTGGESGLWAIEHWNEPWEPDSISGWNGDSLRYRQILKCLHDGVKSVDKRIKVAAACSVMNTEDKLLSGVSRDHIRMVDLMTDHYVSVWAAYGARVAEQHGIVSGETETWGAHSQVLAVQFMTQFLANGQKFINPCTDDMIWSYAPGSEDRDLPVGQNPKEQRTGVITPTPVLAALAVWNALIQDRPFKRMASPTQLPHLFQFGTDADARLVLYGKPTSTGSGRLRDYPWWQVLQGPNGAIDIADPGKVIEVRDLNGNPVPRAADGGYTLTLDTSAFYLWSSQGAQVVIAAVRTGTISGLQAVHLAPGGLDRLPAANAPAALPVMVKNVLNRPVSGKLTVTALSDAAYTAEVPVQLTAGGQTEVRVPVTVPADGGLPLRFVFTPAEEGLAPSSWTEVVHALVISHGRATATTWEALPGATVLRLQGRVSANEIEAIWLPFVKREAATLPARHGTFKLVWDERFLHVSATVDAVGIRSRPRLATRDDRRYFWSQAEGERRFGMLRPYLNLITQPGDKRARDAAEKNPLWPVYQALLEANPDARRVADDRLAYAWAYTLLKRPDASLDEISYVYLPGSRMIDDLPFSGDSLQFAIDVDPPEAVMTSTHDLTYPVERIPARWVAVPDSDYEFALYQCDDGRPELWCLLAPGIPRGHYFPRQERGKVNQHAVPAEVSVEHKDGRTHYHAAIPWSALGGKPWKAGSNVGVTFAFNAADGGSIQFGDQAGATKINSLTLHPYWQPKPSNSLRWVVLP